MSFKFTPYQDTGNTEATTTSGGGAFKFTPYQENKDSTIQGVQPYRSTTEALKQRNVVRGVQPYRSTTDALKVTKPKTTASSLVKDIAAPGRGFTDEQINATQPSASELITGPTKWTGEIASGIASLTGSEPFRRTAQTLGGPFSPANLPANVLKKIPGLRWLVSTKEDIEKAQESFKPDTPGEAKVMRALDIGTVFVGSVSRTGKNAENLNTVRDMLLRRFKDSGVQGKVNNTGEDVARRVIDNLKNNKNPEVTDLNEALEALKASGRNTDDIATELRKIEADISNAGQATARATEPSRTPTSGAKAQTPRFARGAESMIEGASKTTAQVTPRSTAALARQADDIIAKSTPDEILDIARQNNDLGTAVTSRYLNQLARESADAATTSGRKNEIAETVAKLVNEKSTRLMEAGREIQAASLLARMTPEGQLRYVASQIKTYNRKNPSKKVPELNAEQASEILDEMNEIQKIIDPIERQMRFFKLQRRVQEMIPTSNLSKMIALWKAGLLTGIKTTGLNLFSNASHFATELAKDIPAAIADSVMSLFTGKRTTSVTFRNVLNGLREGTHKGKRYFLTGFDERNIGQKLDYKRVNFGKGKVGKAFQAYTDTVFQALGAGDQPFYYATLAKSYMNQALAMARNEGLRGKAAIKRAYEIVEDPTEEMMEYAVRDATTAVFTNETALGKIAQGFQRLGGGAGEFIVPFARTPSAVATQIMNYTPVGTVAEVVKQIRRGKFDQRLLSQAIGRSTVGTVPLAIGWELAGQGLVSLEYPQGDSRQIELDKAEGVEYNSIKIGDEWRNPITLGPAGNLILFGAHIRNAIEKYGSNTKGVGQAALGLMSSFKEQTFLTGFSNFADLIDDPSKRGLGAIRSFVASFVPTIVSDVARATDTVERESPTVATRIASRIPGARQQLEPKVDILGREVAIAGRGGEILPDFIESMADPTRPSQDISTEVTQEISRFIKLAEETNNGDLADAYRKAAPTRTGLFGYDVLTDKQETALQKYAGSIFNDKVRNLILLPAYQQLSDEDKAEAIGKISKLAKDAARARIVLEIIQSIPPEQRRAALIRMYQDSLITNDVERILEG